MSQTADIAPNDTVILEAITIARSNWKDWQTVYEHPSDDHSTNPILADPVTFKKFAHEYSVGRTIRKEKSNEFRSCLVASEDLAAALSDGTAAKFDELAESLRLKFGTLRGGKGDRDANSIVSALSKISSFLKPEVFLAWDRFAKQGLNVLLGRTKSHRFSSYSCFLADINKVWHETHGQRIQETMKERSKSALETEPRFQRRVLDVYLMKMGDRKM